MSKILTTPKQTIKSAVIMETSAEVSAVGAQVKKKIGSLFGGSLAIRQVDAGSDNSCENELVALSNVFYDCERFGIHFVASPRHADMLMVTGPVTRNMAAALVSAYEATPTPKLVVAVGDDAIDGGIFKGSYAVLDGVDSVIPVDYTIAGDPPTPTVILHSLLAILDDLEGKTRIKKK
ncbi:MAG: formate hydrogenlyase [Patescibacteria group bacterium]